MIAPETGREIPADDDRIDFSPEGIFRLTEGNQDFLVQWHEERGMETSQAHWKKRALAAEARIASLEALIHEIASDCRSPTAHAGNALRQIGDKIGRALEGAPDRAASLEAERARAVNGLAERLRQQVANADTDIADALADAETTGEVVDPDDWHVEVPVNWLRECIAALASEKGGQADG